MRKAGMISLRGVWPVVWREQDRARVNLAAMAVSVASGVAPRARAAVPAALARHRRVAVGVEREAQSLYSTGYGPFRDGTWRHLVCSRAALDVRADCRPARS
eukprot:5622995-Prymnesium_polylepis.2